MYQGFYPEIRVIGSGQVTGPEKDAVRWLCRRRTADKFLPSFDESHVYVGRLTSRPYDLLIWRRVTRPRRSVEHWGASGVSLVELCLSEFRTDGYILPRARPYAKFCRVVAIQQQIEDEAWLIGQRPPPYRPSAADSFGYASIGTGNTRLGIGAAKFVEGLLTLELSGRRPRGVHFTADLRLEQRGLNFLGTASFRYAGNPVAVESKVTLEQIHRDEHSLELEGDWVDNQFGMVREELFVDLNLERCTR